MCILFVAIKQHPNYPLIIAANRDEFFARPTARSHIWPASQGIIAGKDLQAGGTWMGINQQGYLAALTNIRAPQTFDIDAITRGELVSHYLQEPSNQYAENLKTNRTKYNGYNLLFGKWHELAVYNNHLNQLESLKAGYYGLSNASLNSPWPKINKGVAKLKDYCARASTISPGNLFSLLKDTQQAPDTALPDTGVPLDWERRLSSIFILGDEYGTRSSTLLLIDNNQKVQWHERTYDNQANCSASVNFNFTIK